MKILHVVKTYIPFTKGGIEEVIRLFSIEYIKHGHEVSVFACYDPKSNSNKGVIKINVESVDCIFFPFLVNFLSSPFSKGMIDYYNEVNEMYDIVIFHAPWPQIDLMIKNRKNPKNVVFYHADALSNFAFGYAEKIYNKINSFSLRKADSIIVTSDNYKKSSPYLKKFLSKTSSFPLALNSNHPSINNETMFEFEVLFEKDSFVLFLGALREYKGIDFLIDCARKTNRIIVVAGGGKNLETYKVKASGIKNLFFLGFVSEHQKSWLLDNCYLLILPSINRGEAFGVVILEALVRGKPVISTELKTGTSFVNLNGITGYVIEPYDIQGMVSKIDSLFDDEKLYLSMSRQAVQRVNDFFDIDKIALDHLNLFYSLLDR